ncbi:TVP38/TMEM64 family protein [Aureibacillus halotolerans]|uniref:TVP38/TMEM64 family membrane protein n=1 Tax=Aureibacillus halotolerans TaxID=1508390 RepID=A0A4R6UDE5_9BACI|nr:TVP38/TMEM64 family protein [Aureibacillus halotolerans]TDQ42805.1 putative membrane protein YdjX (TVP38/TMEM64 family) [Aureibacillus halotolerans]
MKSNKLYIWIALILVIALVLLYLNHTIFHWSPESIRDWLLQFGAWAPIVFMIIYTIRPLTLFPSSVLSITAGLAFGTWFGALYALIGVTSGAILSFWITRRFGKSIRRKQWADTLENIQEKVDQNGFLYVLTFRVMPLNFDLVSYAASMTKVSIGSYIAATLIGILPATLAYTFVGGQLVDNPWVVLFMVIGVAILGIIYFWAKKHVSFLQVTSNKNKDM